ncbi:hypothetical protein E2C01_005430 [Portunus trituberculatus]|uniref:Uncharacterized protein n=1 Tax=Portunus trituberculatus TaxID=210409 RepID=A0A5B7CU72_PORTR|nr:hypothetical protein [Portunus trituberculatus]
MGEADYSGHCMDFLEADIASSCLSYAARQSFLQRPWNVAVRLGTRACQREIGVPSGKEGCGVLHCTTPSHG